MRIRRPLVRSAYVSARAHGAASASVRALLCYWELRVRHYLPTAISLLKDMKAAVGLSAFFAILDALGGSAVRHHYNVRAEHLELILIWCVRSILRTGACSFIVGNQLLLVLRFALGADSQ